MEIRQYFRSDVTVSALAHLSLVAIVVVYTEVRPFRTVVEKTVPVEIVVANEVEKKPDPLPTPTPSPSPEFSLLKPSPPAAPQAAAPPAASPSPPPAAKQAARPARRETSQPPASPQTPQQASAPTPSAPSPPPGAPGYATPEPDPTIKYHVMLGLPEDLPAPEPASSGDKAGNGNGGEVGPATENLASSLVEALRRHLKSCSRLPAALSPSDNVAVKLRVQMTPDGRLAGEPTLIEGSASLKGVELMRGAVAALAACQPYAMLPAERYGEWKVLDLSFTPRDFNS